MEKILTFNDSSKLSDNYEIHSSEDKRSLHAFRGHVKFCNELGEVLLEKDNTIVLRGRTFALEKIFGLPNNLNLGYNSSNLSTKKIAVFKCGNGGCIEGQPFNVLPTFPSDCRELGNEVPFRPVINGIDRPEGYYEQKPLYEGATQDGYFAKTFDNIEWGKNVADGSNDTAEDEVYIKLTLRITEDDFATVPEADVNGNIEYKRSTFINELGLFIANPVKNDAVDRMDNLEMFSRLCFESEPLFNNTKVLVIYYYIYA